MFNQCMKELNFGFWGFSKNTTQHCTINLTWMQRKYVQIFYIYYTHIYMLIYAVYLVSF